MCADDTYNHFKFQPKKAEGPLRASMSVVARAPASPASRSSSFEEYQTKFTLIINDKEEGDWS